MLFTLKPEGKGCLWHNQRRAARDAWVRCEPSTPQQDLRTAEHTCSSKRRAQLFLVNHCHSQHNRACLPGPLWSSSLEGVTHSVQVTRWARNWNCSRSLILAPNSSGNRSPPLSSHAACKEGSRRNPPQAPDIVLSEVVKGLWTQEGYEGPFSTCGQTVLHPLPHVNLQPLGLTGGEEKSNLSFVSTLRLTSRISPSMQVFQQASGSPDQAYPDPHCSYVGCRPVFRPSALHLPRRIWRGIVEAPANVP